LTTDKRLECGSGAHERLTEIPAGLRYLVFIIPMLKNALILATPGEDLDGPGV
jgi:hypothetical protein